MPITPWVPAIQTISDGQDVSAEVVNPILAQYTQRTQYLYETFSEFGDRSVLIAYGLPIRNVDPKPVMNNFVSYVKDSDTVEGLALTQVEFLADPANQISFTLANSSFPIGIVKQVSGNVADVYLQGIISLSYDIDDVDHGLIQTGETFSGPSPYYLSKDYAGKMTKNPVGVAVYVGYAIDNRTFLLAPNVNEFSQLFTTYRYNILDRPAGVPTYSLGAWSSMNTGGTWSVGNPDITKVGWINVSDLVTLAPAIYALAPAGAQFYYNLPSGTIVSDTGITAYDRGEQASLARVLSFVSPNLSLLTINGIGQSLNTENDPSGIYTINELGLWWFNNNDGEQPWASDIPQNKVVTVASHIMTLNNHGFQIDDVVYFSTTGTLPAPLTINTPYYVVSFDTNTFVVAAAVDGTPITLTTNGTGVQSIYQPYIWKSFRGTDNIRPRIALQFIKFNPDIRNSFVTSLKEYNPNSTALRFYTGDGSALSTSGTGDLLARLSLAFNNSSTPVNSATAISGISYTESSGAIVCATTPVVSSLTGVGGISITPTTIGGTPVPGSFIISTATGSASGQVTSLEPDGAELLYTGLHSYVSMTNPSVVPSSVIGKITLPAGTPVSDMSFVMFLIGFENVSSTKAVNFDFSYAVSKPGILVDTTMTTTAVTFNMPNPYVAKTVFKLVIPAMAIPASAFSGGDCSVNFKLARTDNTPLTSAVGLVDIYWKIG